MSKNRLQNGETHTEQSAAIDWRAFSLNIVQRLIDAQQRPFLTVWRFLEVSVLRAAARSNLSFIAKRRTKYERLAKKRDPKRYLELFGKLNVAEQYANGMAEKAQQRSTYVEYDPALSPPKTDIRLVAFYLPQFHPFPENDEWWGTGFTEWRNTVKARPIFSGHYQPHLPTHFGYYDLRVPNVMEEQAKVAKQYGIGGFAYYFYWFGGKTLMEEPLKAMLNNLAVDMPFCLSWANENWTRRWDGKDNELLIAQAYSEDDSRALIRHLSEYFKDPRYIRIDQRPVFLVYRPRLIPDIVKHVAILRDEARRLGLGELYIIGNQRDWDEDHTTIGLDASLEFPPHGLDTANYALATDAGETFKGRIYDYVEMTEMSLSRPAVDYPVFRGVTLSWDNTARRNNNATLFKNFTLETYGLWLQEQCRITRARDCNADEKIVFINAWNEWAEGTHLEPDERFGFAYLDTTRRALLAGQG